MADTSLHSNCCGASHGCSLKLHQTNSAQASPRQVSSSERQQHTTATRGAHAHLTRNQQHGDRATGGRTPSNNKRPGAVSVYTIGPLNSPHSYPAIPSIASYASYSPYARRARQEHFAFPPVSEGFTPIPYLVPETTKPRTQSAPRGLPSVKSKVTKKEQQPLLYENGMINLQPLALLGKKKSVGRATRNSGVKLDNLRKKRPSSSKGKNTTVVHLDGLEVRRHSEPTPDMTTVLSSPSPAAFRFAGHEDGESGQDHVSDSVQITSGQSPRRSLDDSFLAHLLNTDEGEGHHHAKSAPVSCLKKRSDDSDVTSLSSDSSSKAKTVRFMQISSRSPSPDGSESPPSEASPRPSDGDHADDASQPHITATSRGSLQLRITGKKKRRSAPAATVHDPEVYGHDALDGSEVTDRSTHGGQQEVVYTPGRQPTVVRGDPFHTDGISEATQTECVPEAGTPPPEESSPPPASPVEEIEEESPPPRRQLSPTEEVEEEENHSADESTPRDAAAADPETTVSSDPDNSPAVPASAPSPRSEHDRADPSPDTSPRHVESPSQEPPRSPADPAEREGPSPRAVLSSPQSEQNENEATGKAPTSPTTSPKDSSNPVSSADATTSPASPRRKDSNSRPVEQNDNPRTPDTVPRSPQYETFQRYPPSPREHASSAGPSIAAEPHVYVSLHPEPESRSHSAAQVSSPRQTNSTMPRESSDTTRDTSISSKSRHTAHPQMAERDDPHKGRNKGEARGKGDKWDDRMHIWLTQTAWKQEVQMD